MLAFCAGMKANAEAAGDRGEFLGGLAGILAGLAWKTESPIAAGGAAVSGILSGANIMDKYMLRLEARAMSCPK